MSPGTVATDTPQDIPIPQWVISDTHFGHENILAYCPWRKTWAQTVAEHDAALIAAWREIVRPSDWVLHLGDVALGSKERTATIRKHLTGRIILVRGNHDRSVAIMRSAGYDLVCSAIRVTANGHHLIGRHNPAAFSVREARSAQRLLHGHCHGNGIAETIHHEVRTKAYDCSLDAIRSLAPVPWSTVHG
jgi:calcineurin-like phosphoesterase family protein